MITCAKFDGKVPCRVAVRRKFNVLNEKMQFVFETDGTEFDDFGFDELQAVAESKHVLIMLVNDEQWMAPAPVVYIFVLPYILFLHALNLCSHIWPDVGLELEGIVTELLSYIV